MQPAAAEGQIVMTAMDVGWSDVGTWSALLDALVGGYDSAARVVPPGEEMSLGVDDIGVWRVDDDHHLSYQVGPLTRMVDSERPMAYLPAARQHEPAIAGLIERVWKWEMSQTANAPSEVPA